MSRKWNVTELRRVIETARHLGVNCILCHENLTAAERHEGRVYCAACWPEEIECRDDEDE